MNCPICGVLCVSNEGHYGPGSYSHQCSNDCYWESRAYGNTSVNIGYEDEDRLTLAWPDGTPEAEVQARRLLISAFAQYFIYAAEAEDARTPDEEPPPPSENMFTTRASIVVDGHISTAGIISTAEFVDTQIRLQRTLPATAQGLPDNHRPLSPYFEYTDDDDIPF